MDNPLAKQTDLTDFRSPINSNQKAFLGKELKISHKAEQTIKQLPHHEQLKLHNKLNTLVTDIVNHKLHSNKHIYFELPHSFLKFSVGQASAPYIGTITHAKVIKKLRPLKPKAAKKSHPLNCGIRTARGLAKEIVNTHYEFEKIIKPNIYTAEELVDMQVRRMREHVKSWQIAGQTSTQWADVCFGAKPGFLNIGTGDEIIALSAIFPISERTKIMHKSYFSAMRQTSIKKILHRYAVIFGYPDTNDKKLQKSLSNTNPYKKDNIKEYSISNIRFNSDVVIKIDNELNIHKFYRNGEYAFVDCSNSI
ncbi:hypothetical protein [Kangiella shandongensis]|uniref:hypothetical protein n=1 Tax=Kangiella shandongensis TaxID=2763258 RepID=UPI001CBA7F1E|nr:hypothetical protein [Kangiella shandongensis]